MARGNPVNGLLRLTLDEKRTLERLAAQCRGAYLVSYDGHRWRASRKDGTTLRGLTPDDLAAALRASIR